MRLLKSLFWVWHQKKPSDERQDLESFFLAGASLDTPAQSTQRNSTRSCRNSLGHPFISLRTAGHYMHSGSMLLIAKLKDGADAKLSAACGGGAATGQITNAWCMQDDVALTQTARMLQMCQCHCRSFKSICAEPSLSAIEQEEQHAHMWIDKPAMI